MGYSARKWAEVLRIISGKNQKEVESPNGNFPIYGSGGIIGYANDYLCEPGTTIVGRKGTINNPIFVNERFWNVDTAFGVSPGQELLPKYLFYFCLSFNFKALDKSTTIPSLAKRDLLDIEMPTPPLVEQERIVARIEELFSQLDASVAELKTAKERLKVYRQAVLKEVFDGVGDVCETTTIQSVCEDIKVGIVIKPAQYYTDLQSGIPAFRSANIREFHIQDRDWVYLTKAGHEANNRSEVHTDDVLIVRSGYPGTACVVPERYDGYNAIDILIAVPNTSVVLPEYLCAYTNSPYGKQLIREKKRGVAQAHLNVGGYSKMAIPIPSIDAQREVLLTFESRLSVCDSIEKAVDTALQQAEALRQSILKKAFEGGL